jgi:hypothetical protein
MVPDGPKKQKVSWTQWHAEATSIANVHAQMCQQVMVASLAGQLGLTVELPNLCAQMISWGYTADWLGRLTGAEGQGASMAAWASCAAIVRQLCATKALVGEVCAVADIALQHGSADAVEPIAMLLLKNYENHPEFADFLRARGRGKWSLPVVTAVENLAANYPGVAHLIREVSEVGSPARDLPAVEPVPEEPMPEAIAA